MNQQAIYYAAYLEGLSKRVRALNYDSDAPYDADALDNAARVMRELLTDQTRQPTPEGGCPDHPRHSFRDCPLCEIEVTGPQVIDEMKEHYRPRQTRGE